jgi:hypothetical protein
MIHAFSGMLIEGIYYPNIIAFYPQATYKRQPRVDYLVYVDVLHVFYYVPQTNLLWQFAFSSR